MSTESAKTGPPATTSATATSEAEHRPANAGTLATAPIDRFRWGLEKWAAHALTQHVAGNPARKDRAKVEWIEDELRQFAAELAGPNPTPIERTLSETAALAWLSLRHTHITVTLASERTLKQADYDIRRHDAAQRRYLTTLRTLAQVRKLAIPTLQVNIGKTQQVVNQAC